jgi:hypothetical protein
LIPLCVWPVPRRRDWLQWVNEPQTAAEEEALQHALRFSRPFGSQPWTAQMEKRLKLGPLRPRGRPPKEANARKNKR